MQSENQCYQFGVSPFSKIFTVFFLFISIGTLTAQHEGSTAKEVDMNMLEFWFNSYASAPSEEAFTALMDSASTFVNACMQKRNFDGVKTIYEKCLALGHQTNDAKVQLRFTVLLGNYHKIRGNFVKSNEVLLAGIDHNGITSDKAQQYLLIASNYFQIDLTKSSSYISDAEKIITEVQDTATLMLYHNDKAEYYRRTNDLNKAIEEEIIAMEFMDQFPIQKVASLTKLSGYLLELKNPKPALEYINQATLLYEPNKNQRLHAFVLMSKSKISFYQKQYKDAIKEITASYDYLKTTGLKNQHTKCLGYLASYSLAAEDHIQYEFAIKELEKVIQSLNDNAYKITGLLTLADDQIRKGNFVKAKQFFHGIDQKVLPKDFGYKDHFLKTKAKILAHNSKEQAAIETLEQLVTYKDSIESLNSKNIVAYQENKFNRAQKEKEIVLLSSLSESKSKKLWMISTMALALGILLLTSTYLYKKLKSKNQQIISQSDQLKSLIADKDVLIREIHHRVKNNLQVVSSLLNLQSNYISDKIALKAINEGKNRVLSMALIHQNLYTDDHLTDIETKAYFNQLVDQLFESYNIDETRIILKKDIDAVMIDVDIMVPLGLICNELISNALKHAFDEGESGQVKLTFRKLIDRISLQIEDNGKGMDASTFTSSKSFGNKMIKAFVQKLKAELEIKNEAGTKVLLSIPNRTKAIKNSIES